MSGHKGTEVSKLADIMANAAETNLGTPYSLICDAWDNLDNLPDYMPKQYTVAEMRKMFLEALETAVQTYHANDAKYTFNDKAF